MPIEEYKRVYTPCIVDTIKWDYDYFDRSYLDTQTGDVLKNWATIGVKNFPAYVKAYCLETFGYWKIGARNSNGDMMEGIIENVYGYDLYTINLLQKLPGGAVLERMQTALQFHFSAGTLFALWVLCLALLLRRRAYKLALVLAPGAFLWITCLLYTSPSGCIQHAVCLFAPGGVPADSAAADVDERRAIMTKNSQRI